MLYGSPSRLIGHLESLRGRLFLRFGLEAGIRLLSCVLSLFFLSVCLFALDAPGWLIRGLFWIPLLGVSAYLILKLVVKPRKLYSSIARLASVVEWRIPAFADRLVSACELAETDPDKAYYSPILAIASIGDMEKRLSSIREESIAPLKELGAPAIRAGIALLLVALAAVIGPAHTGAAFASLWGNHSPDLKAGELHFLMGDITIHYHYPDYTGLNPLRIENASGDIEAYPGTRVGIQATSAEHCGTAVILMDEGDEVPLSRVEGNLFEGSFVVTGKDGYRFECDGSADSRSRQIHIVKDRDPFAALDYPPEELEVRETDRIELAFRLSDDFGLKQAELVFNYDAGKKREDGRFALKTFDKNRKSFEGAVLWDLSPYSFAPGDRVTYYVEVLDNDSVSGPKTGRSRTHVLKVFSVHDHHRKLLDLQEEIWEAMLGLLAKYLEQVIDEKTVPDADSLMKVYSDTDLELTQAILDPLGRLIGEMKEDPLATKAATELLASIHDDFERNKNDYLKSRWKLERDVQIWDGPESRRTVNGLYRLRALREETIGRLEKAVIDLYELLQKQKYDALVSESEKLADLRDELRQLMEEYRNTKDPALMERIEELLREFRERLNELYKKMADIAKEIPEDFVNMEALTSNNIEGNLDTLAELLKSGDLEKALKELENLSQQLNDMLEQLKEGSENLGDSLYSESMQKLLNFDKDLEQLTRKEEELHDQTEKSFEGYREKLKKRLKNGFELVAKRLAEKVKLARTETGKIENTPNIQARHDRDGAISHMEDLEKTLEATDLKGAEEITKHTQRSLESLSWSLKATYRRQGEPDPEKENKEHAREAKRIIDEVARELKEIMPDPNKILSRKEKDLLDQQALKQRELSREANRLRNDVRGMMSEVPFMPGDAEELMNDAANGMEQSRQRLSKRNPGGASGHQQQSIHSMKTLKQGLEQAMQQMQSGMKFGGMRPMMRRGGGRRLSREEVAIPKAEDYKTPKELREDLLEAMKKKAPETYEPQNRQYYKELVK